MCYAELQKRTHLKAPRSPSPQLLSWSRREQDDAPKCPTLPRDAPAFRGLAKRTQTRFCWHGFSTRASIARSPARVGNTCHVGRSIRSKIFNNVQGCSALFSAKQNAQNEPTAPRPARLSAGNDRDTFPVCTESSPRSSPSPSPSP